MTTSTPILDTYIFSDLHMAEGNLGCGEYLGTENFLADIEMEQCLDHLSAQHRADSTQAHIIINGDVVDFIRTTSYPSNEDEIKQWQKELDMVEAGIVVGPHLISPKEVEYGLKTNDYKTIWKLYIIMRGHARVFGSLAKWIAEGNRLTIGVGNHDPEWYWPLVQQYFSIKLCQLYEQSELTTAISKPAFIDSIQYYTVGISPYEKVWVEHGNRYDRMTRMCPDFEYHPCMLRESLWYRWRKKNNPIIPQREKELAIPFGSFFNRYLVNKVEFKFPNVNNLTTGKALINTLFKEDFKTAFYLLKHYAWYCIRIVVKNFKKSLLEIFLKVSINILPLALFAWGIYDSMSSELPLIKGIPTWANSLLEIARNVLLLLSRYIFQFIIDKLGLKDHPLPEVAMSQISKGGKLDKYDIIVVGHNHTPDHQTKAGKQYVNTGAWIRKYIFTFKQIQDGDVYALAHLKLHNDQSVEVKLLQWDKAIGKLRLLPSYLNR
jgi:UDP-2,3-diacylglucosamine pyrophosphatase LpxH